MKHIHISLVGSQAYPAFLGIADLQPDEVILVHSTSTKEEAMMIQNQIDMPSKLFVLDPVHVLDVYQKVKAFSEQIDEQDYYSINLTGGTKVWSIAFYEYFRFLPNVKLIYVDQNNHIYDLCTQESHLSKVEMNIDMVFKLNGIKSPQSVSFTDYNQQDQSCLDTIQKLRAFSFDGFRALSCPNEQQKGLLMRREGEFNYGPSNVKWNRDAQTLRVRLFNKRGKEMQASFTAPHIISLFFNYNWFEYTVALLLSKWSRATEILMNVRFPYSDNQHPKNEIDIIVNTGNKLLFVECKTQISDITDIDKFRTAVKNYGGMGAKALFITLDKMKDTAAEKCKDSGIMAFSLNDCPFTTPDRMLFLMLEQELFSINKK